MAADPADPPARAPTTLSQFVESASKVIAPISLLTAVLVYIGWTRTGAFYGYFGLSPSLVAFTPQDYILRSANVGFGGILLLALAGATLLVIDSLLALLLRRAGRWAPRIRHLLIGFGAVAGVLALGSAATSASFGNLPPIAGAGLLAFGAVTLLRFGNAARGRARRLPLAVQGLAIVTLVLAGFWASTSYAQNLGVNAAEAIDRYPNTLSLVTLYANDPIDLAGSTIRATRNLDADNHWKYRYTGLRLLTYSNSRWFFIPEIASGGYRSTVTVIADSDKMRVELSAPG